MHASDQELLEIPRFTEAMVEGLRALEPDKYTTRKSTRLRKMKLIY